MMGIFYALALLLVFLAIGTSVHAQDDEMRRGGIVEVRRGVNNAILRTRTGNECDFVGTITFGGPFSLEHFDRFFVLGSSQLVGYLLVVDYVNRFRCGIAMDGKNYKIELRTYDDQSSAEYSKAIADYIVNATNVDVMLGGYSSGLTEPLASVAHENSRVLLSPGAAATSVFADREGIFGTQPPTTKYIVKAIEGLASVGAKTIATVWEDASFTRGICSSAPEHAAANGLEVTSAHEVQNAPNVTVMQELAKQVSQEDPDVVITCVYDKGCESWLQALRNIGWSPRAQVFTVCVGFQEFARASGTDAQYIMGVTPWDSSLNIQDAVTGWSASDFGERYLSETADDDVKYQAASASAVISIAIQAIESTNSLNETILSKHIATNSFQTIYGEISFDENGQSQAPVSLFQYDSNGQVQSVYPTEIASGSILYPMPTWGHRDCVRLSVCESEGDTCSKTGNCICSDSSDVSVGMGETAECLPEEDMNYIVQAALILGYIMVALLGAMSIFCLGWVYKYQNSPLVKFSQPLFMVLLVIGCMISTLSIVPLGVETAYRDSENIELVDVACMAVPWLWGVGFGITFSAIFAKVRRVKKIYDAGRAMIRKPVQAKDVLSTMFLVVFTELVILTVWQVVSPHKWQRDVITDINGYATESVGQCTSEYGWWFLLSLVGFNVLCLCYAIVLCFQTKHLPSEFAESSHIFMAVMFMFQILVLAVPVSAMVREQTYVFYFARACAIFLQNFTVLAIVFGPKMYRIYKKDDTLEVIKQSVARGSTSRKQLSLRTTEAVINAAGPHGAENDTSDRQQGTRPHELFQEPDKDSSEILRRGLSSSERSRSCNIEDSTESVEYESRAGRSPKVSTVNWAGEVPPDEDKVM